MADVPSDPEQLARQILSGRVSIQQLAQEQARRRAAGAGGGRPSANPPAQPRPAARMMPATPPNRPATTPPAKSHYQASGSVVRQPGMATSFPARPAPTRVSNSMGSPRIGSAGSTSNQPQRVGGSRPARAVTGGAKPAAGAAKPMAGGAQATAGSATAAAVQGPAGAGSGAVHPASSPQVIATAMLKDPRYLRSAFILTEIIGKPLALRDDSTSL